MRRYELSPIDGRKSFYGKAIVTIDDDGTEILYSYVTPVIKCDPHGNLERLYDEWSSTTGRHIKAFCGLNKKEFFDLPYKEGKNENEI